DRDARSIGHRPDFTKLIVASDRREVSFQVIIHLNAVKTSTPGQFEAFLERHLPWVGKRPKINGLLHRVLLGSTLQGAGLSRECGCLARCCKPPQRTSKQGSVLQPLAPIEE